MSYTTREIVRYKLEAASSVPDSNIDRFIIHAKDLIDAHAKTSFSDAQANNSIVEQAASDIAAFYCISYKPSLFTTMSNAVLSADLFWQASKYSLNLLKDAEIVKFIKSGFLSHLWAQEVDYMYKNYLFSSIHGSYPLRSDKFLRHASAIAAAKARQNIPLVNGQDSLPRQTCADLAAFFALAFNVEYWPSNSDASLTANMLWESANHGLNLLADTEISNYLINLV